MIPFNEATVGCFINVILVLTTRRGCIHRLRFTDGLDAGHYLRWYRNHPRVATVALEKI